MDRLEALHSFLKEDPQDPFTRFALASEYLKRGDLEQALSFFEQLVSDQPGYIGTYYHLGKLYLSLEQPARAIDTFKKGISVAQQQRNVHALSELRDILMQAEGIGFDDEDD